MTKRESQLSFNLSDLSDEEVDRRITRLTVEIENEVNLNTDGEKAVKENKLYFLIA